MRDRLTDQDLNAYIDGELSPHDDAHVAQAIAQNPTIAARVASLTRLKSMLSSLRDEMPEPVALPDPHRAIRWLGIAASAGLLAAVGIVMLMLLTPFGKGDDGWYREALAEHAGWARDPALPDAGEVDANLFLASVERFGLPVQTPDLTSASLRLTYLHYYPPTETAAAALHLGYTGRRGCKVTLWVSAAPGGLGTALTETRVDNLRGFRWRSGETAYALFATGMAERRFTVIASKVYEATRSRRGFDEGTRMALKSASTSVPPCQA
jgi:anti-sigma factor RsiW